MAPIEVVAAVAGVADGAGGEGGGEGGAGAERNGKAPTPAAFLDGQFCYRCLVETDAILEVGIDEANQLYLHPSRGEFPYIYREAMDVHWDTVRKHLYMHAPREWTYEMCLNQILDAAQEQSSILQLAEGTIWKNISPSLKSELLELFRRR